MALFGGLLLAFSLVCGTGVVAAAKPKIYISFLWHMHQPIYWPYESIRETQQKGRYSFDLYDVFNQRYGAYTDWPRHAIHQAKDAGLPHAGSQISFSGSLIENMNELYGSGWSRAYAEARKWKTSLGNPRLDLVGFGFHHPMMPLIPYEDIRLQISAHRKAVLDTFGRDAGYSKGMFPPENGFADWIIPALVDEGIEWVFVDNIHLNRARQQYPWSKGENLFPPNPSQQRNPPLGNSKWFNLDGVWAPSKVSAWAERPHWIVYRDPKTGAVARTPDGKPARMVVVPTERYLGNEDGRGGFGALNYEHVMSQFEAYNTDPAHPVLLVLHHDGDNYGGGTSSYYHENFSRFVNWLNENPERFEYTTVQDYLDRFPPAGEDVIHVEPGSWSGADNGDPEFKKWFGDPVNNYSPDRNSWAVMIAAQNLIRQAESLDLPKNVIDEALKYYLVAETSCYEYWDGTEVWDGHPTRAANKVVDLIKNRISSKNDTTPPSLLIPQREPYNPGGMEWNNGPESSDFEVWSYLFDISGLKKVQLRYRVQEGVKYPEKESDYSWSNGLWQDIPMTGKSIPSQTNPRPLLKANEYSARIEGVKDSLVSYYIYAQDNKGNVATSHLFHVYVGKGETSGSDFSYAPLNPGRDDIITIYSKRPAILHWGVNGWTLPNKLYWPGGTSEWGDGKAVRSPMAFDKKNNKYAVAIGPFSSPVQKISELNFILNYENDDWGPHDIRIEFKE